MRDTFDMAREVGIEFQRNIGPLGRESISTAGSQSLEKIERLVELARADERKIVMNEPLTKEMWQRFEDEIRADEREACAKVCDAASNNPNEWAYERAMAARCAAAIRARGES